MSPVPDVPNRNSQSKIGKWEWALLLEGIMGTLFVGLSIYGT